MCAFRFEDDGGEDAAEGFTVLDAEGERLFLVTREANRMSSMHVADVVGGRSQVFWIREDASRLVLRRGGEVVASQPMHLVPGEITVVRRAR